ncbi:hypothetical protein JVU11DRAFT_7402 [Chiua virens]|nr:hypothetical protein JVU11DRAFT_7402 [Chiua virens]
MSSTLSSSYSSPTDTGPSTSALATSQEIRDRGSTFVACIYRAATIDEVKSAAAAQGDPHPPAQRTACGDGRATQHAASGSGLLADTRADVSYAMVAWRCMVLKPGRTGLSGPEEFDVGEGWEDGREMGAGRRVLGVMQREGVLDAVVVVRRWYVAPLFSVCVCVVVDESLKQSGSRFGGILLGPVRFTHIEMCASEVCRRFKKVEQMEECVHTLDTLDGVLDALRAQLAVVREQAGMQDQSSSIAESETARSKRKVPDYRAMQDALDLSKAKRLIHARECAVNNTKVLIEKYKLQVKG